MTSADGSFWKDRAPTAHETGHHLTGDYSAVETAISHLSFATHALAPLSLSEQDRGRVMGLVEKLKLTVGEKNVLGKS